MGGSFLMVVVFPVAGDGERELRWVAEPGAFRETAAVLSFGEMPWPVWLESARIESHRDLVLRLRVGEQWDARADWAWQFVPAAVAAAESWVVRPDADTGSARVAADERLCQAVCGVLEGEFGDYVASHGGAIELVDVHDGTVRVKLTGACSTCSLADWTLRLRLERDLKIAAGPDFAQLVTI